MAGPTSVLFLGMQASFSTPVLAALIAARMEICGVLIPASDEPLPKPLAHSDAEPVAESGLRRLLPLPSPSVGGGLQILTPFVRPGVVQLAWEAGIPVYEARSLAAGDVLARVRELRPDVMAVACWPGLIPRAFSALAGLAALNVHPSCLIIAVRLRCSGRSALAGGRPVSACTSCPARPTPGPCSGSTGCGWRKASRGRRWSGAAPKQAGRCWSGRSVSWRQAAPTPVPRT